MIYGIDFLGGARYQEIAYRNQPLEFAFGCFYKTFGDAHKLIDRMAKSDKCSRIRVHLLWSDSHTFTDKDIPTAVKLAKRLMRLVVKYPSTEFRISPCCEHRMNLSLAKKFRDAIKPHIPGATYVNTPMKGGAVLPDEVNEFHGEAPINYKGRCDFSFDGKSSVDADIEKIKRGCADAETFYLWVPQFNLRKTIADPTPRPNRKAVPTKALIESVAFQSDDRGAVRMPRGFLWKSHADQHNAPVPESRASKPVLICPVEAKNFELVLDNGKVLARSNAKSTFTDGRKLYRFADFGYQMADKAVAIQGHPIVRLRANGKFYGKLNPGFRLGEYR